MGLLELQVLFESVNDAGLLPPASDVQRHYDSMLTAPAPDLVSQLQSNPIFAQYAVVVRGVISDMTNEEIANALIPYLEIYYPDMIQSLDESPEAAKKFGAVLTGVLNIIRGA